MKQKLLQLEMEKELGSDSAPCFTVRLGKTVLGASFVRTEAGLSEWLKLNHPNRRNVGYELIGVSLFRGIPNCRRLCDIKGSKSHPKNRHNPILFIAMCFGTDVLLYQHQPRCLGGSPNKIKELRDLFADKRVRVAGFGLKADSDALKKEWGIYVANPFELNGSLRGEKVETVAEKVLGVKVAGRPARWADMDWGSSGLKGDDLMLSFAVRDAFLCHEIAMHV